MELHSYHAFLNVLRNQGGPVASRRTDLHQCIRMGWLEKVRSVRTLNFQKAVLDAVVVVLQDITWEAAHLERCSEYCRQRDLCSVETVLDTVNPSIRRILSSVRAVVLRCQVKPETTRSHTVEKVIELRTEKVGSVTSRRTGWATWAPRMFRRSGL